MLDVYRCPYCGSWFAEKKELVEHLNLVHRYEGIKKIDWKKRRIKIEIEITAPNKAVLFMAWSEIHHALRIIERNLKIKSLYSRIEEGEVEDAEVESGAGD